MSTAKGFAWARIPLPFDDALKAAMKVPADKLAKPNGKKPKTAKKQPKA